MFRWGPRSRWDMDGKCLNQRCPSSVSLHGSVILIPLMMTDDTARFSVGQSSIWDLGRIGKVRCRDAAMPMTM